MCKIHTQKVQRNYGEIPKWGEADNTRGRADKFGQWSLMGYHLCKMTTEGTYRLRGTIYTRVSFSGGGTE